MRIVDLAVASVLLVCAAPLLVILVAAIKIDSRGPVFFRHQRVGRDGRAFGVLKFRTMRRGDDGFGYDTGQAGHFKVTHDNPAVTRVGRFLRRSGLDEVPQLINVLHGTMAMVGIRPMVEPELAAEDAEFQEIYRALRPGLTGRWQIRGRLDTLHHAGRTDHDIEWARRRTVRGDIAIMLLTPMAMIRGCRTTPTIPADTAFPAA